MRRSGVSCSPVRGSTNADACASQSSLKLVDNAEIQEIQQDQVDQLGGTDDETVIQRRDRMIGDVKLKLTKVNKNRAENQRRAEQIQSELSSCLTKVK